MFKIYDGRKELFQWDLDRKLTVSDESVDEVHFCNRTDDCALVVKVHEYEGVRVADIPNVLLQTAWPIRAYAYCGSCYTKVSAMFHVLARTKPSDYLYEEIEILNYNELEQRMTDLEKTISAIEYDGQVIVEDVVK